MTHFGELSVHNDAVRLEAITQPSTDAEALS
jgi:hypothetical protein